MTYDKDHPLVHEARRILGQYSEAAREAIAEGLYGARDAQFAIAVLALVRTPREHELKIEELQEQLADAQRELKDANEQNASDEAELRELLGQACDVIEANCSGFVDLVDELRANT